MPIRELPDTSGLMKFSGRSPFKTLTTSCAVRRSNSTVEAWEKNAVCGVMMTLSNASKG